MTLRRQRSGRAPGMGTRDPRGRADALAGISKTDVGPGLGVDRRGRIKLVAARDPGDHTPNSRHTTDQQVAAIVDAHNALLRELRAAGIIGG